MSEQTKSYDAQEFLGRLVRNEITSPLIFTGMVKQAGDDKHLLFAFGTHCEHWSKVPLEIIEKVEVLQILPCKDHTHPFVKLHFKHPASGEGQFFAALAAQLASAIHPCGAGGPEASFLAARRGTGDTTGNPEVDCTLNWLKCSLDCEHKYPDDPATQAICKVVCDLIRKLCDLFGRIGGGGKKGSVIF